MNSFFNFVILLVVGVVVIPRRGGDKKGLKDKINRSDRRREVTIKKTKIEIIGGRRRRKGKILKLGVKKMVEGHQVNFLRMVGRHLYVVVVVVVVGVIVVVIVGVVVVVVVIVVLVIVVIFNLPVGVHVHSTTTKTTKTTTQFSMKWKTEERTQS